MRDYKHLRLASRGLVGALLIAAGVAVSACSPSTGSAEPPNIVLISVDTLRADRLHCYGYERETSPSIDRLAADGVLFSQARSPASWTLPAHASIFLGAPVGSHGIVSGQKRISDSQPTLAELLRRQGYATAGFFSGFFVSKRFGFHQGFDVYEPGPEDFASPASAPSVNAKVKAWLGAERQGPFFLFLHYFDVHGPYVEQLPTVASFRRHSEPPSELARLFTDPDRSPRNDKTVLRRAKRRELGELLVGTGLGLPAQPLGRKTLQRLRDKLQRQGNETTAAAVWALAGAREADFMTPEDIRWISDSYDDGVRYLDAFIEEVLSALRRMGVYDDTAIVLTSDHGEMLLEQPGLIGHRRFLYEPVLHVPLIVKPPGGAGGRRIEDLVSTVDIFRTLLDFSGVEASSSSYSRSLRPFWNGRPSPRDVGLSEEYTQDLSPHWALLAHPWKLIIRRAGRGKGELFNLVDDPGEQVNLMAVETRTVERLRVVLDAAVRETQSSRVGEPADLSPHPETARHLRALGYLD